ncbi:hypothetical protein LY474_11910 [Myxococcus stipitatus]|uniref:hypothetical protein n=1 Tax=Myxococcus stipitatus TaxID=83455 RepID=UPI001F3BA7FF|nr:hypothetical protein [Myxococcus stipitatus]MCE9668517.1 hypothetical protein [Myxococcus stipitatus]
MNHAVLVDIHKKVLFVTWTLLHSLFRRFTPLVHPLLSWVCMSPSHRWDLLIARCPKAVVREVRGSEGALEAGTSRGTRVENAGWSGGADKKRETPCTKRFRPLHGSTC